MNLFSKTGSLIDGHLEGDGHVAELPPQYSQVLLRALEHRTSTALHHHARVEGLLVEVRGLTTALSPLGLTLRMHRIFSLTGTTTLT